MVALGRKPFTYAELKAGLAIIIRAGADRDNISLIESLFDPKDSKPFYSCAMSKNRIRLLLRHITLDNKADRRERQVDDKLAAVREIWSLFQLNLRQCYTPSKDLTVDEQLYGYKGYVPGRCYMPLKPAKYGVKIFWLCDALNGYALESYLYSGRQETRAVGLAKNVVLHLTERFSGTGRNIYMDRYFSSHELFVLLLERNLTATGTIQSNRRDVPFILKTARGRERFSSKFLWDHNNRVVMTSYVPRRGKNVLLMSSSHTSEEISSREDKKPVIIMDYNLGKGGVDVMDSRIEDYSCKRKTSRYPLIFLFNMLDIALLNSFLLMEMTGYSKDRRSFIKAVADQLAKENTRGD